jgi:hypothetical protein
MEFKQLGTIILLAVGIIVAIAFMTGSIFPTIGDMTNKVNVPITTQVTFPTNTTAITLTGQAVESVVFINGTTTISAGNYTVTNRVVSNGALVSQVIANGPTAFQGQANVNVSYTYEPFGYQASSGNRAAINMIAIFASLALAVFALSKVMEGGLSDLID